MAYSSGVFSLFTPGNPVVTGTTIASTWANNTLSDIATGLSTCVLKDGTQTITANIPMSAFKFTGLGAGTSNGDSLRYEQLFTSSSGTLALLGNFTVAGTGPSAIGGAATADVQLRLTGTLTGNVTNATAFYADPTLSVPVGGTGSILRSAATATLNKAGSGTHPDFAGLYLEPPTIGAGAATLTNSSTLKITGAPSTGTNQRALWVAAGLSQFDGNLTATGTTALNGSTTTTTQSSGDNSTKLATTAYVDKQSAKAYVNFTAGASPTINGTALNVSSVTQNATGDYTIHFTNAIGTTTYVPVGSALSTGGGGVVSWTVEFYSLASGTVSLRIKQGSTLGDTTTYVTIFGS